MEVIKSFTIDHTNLKPGIYVSREDKGFTTFDLRITEPNKEPAVAPAAIHSIEHLMATWFRNSQGYVYHYDGQLHRRGYAPTDHRVPGMDSHTEGSTCYNSRDMWQLPAP